MSDEELTSLSLRVPTRIADALRLGARKMRRSLNSEAIVQLDKALCAENEKAETAVALPAE